MKISKKCYCKFQYFRIPISLLYLAAIYATLFGVGFFLCVEYTNTEGKVAKETSKESRSQLVKAR